MAHKPIFLLLCALIVNGCASTTEPLTPDVRQHLGKVYLNSNGTTGETFFHASFANGGTSGALKGAGQGALNNLDSCLNSAMGAGGLAPVVLLVCTPMMVPAGIVEGTKAGSKPIVPAETIVTLEKQTNEMLQQADLSPALVATLDDVSQRNHTLANYEIAHGILPEPQNNESIYSVAAKWDYQTVMDVQVTKAGFESDDGKAPMMHFSMTAHIKLVEAATGKLIKEQDYSYDSKAQPIKPLVNDEHRILGVAIVQANKILANNIIDDVFIK